MSRAPTCVLRPHWLLIGIACHETRLLIGSRASILVSPLPSHSRVTRRVGREGSQVEGGLS